MAQETRKSLPRAWTNTVSKMHSWLLGYRSTNNNKSTNPSCYCFADVHVNTVVNQTSRFADVQWTSTLDISRVGQHMDLPQNYTYTLLVTVLLHY